MPRFQIQDDHGNGRALVDAATAKDAILDWIAARERGLHSPLVTHNDDGSATTVTRGISFRAVPVSHPTETASPAG